MVTASVELASTMGVVMIDTGLVVLAAVVGAFGLVLIVAGFMGAFPTKAEDSEGRELTERGIRAMSAFGVGLIIYLVTGWFVATLFAAIGGWFALTLKNAKRERHAAIDRVDAIATWVESLRDNISGSAGLQQALRMSADHAPAAIRREVRDLVLRLQHEPVTVALRRFAAEVAHPTADMAVACLILATSRSAGSLAGVLARTAQAARDSATMLRQVEAGRAATQSQAKLVALITGGMSLVLIVSNRGFVEPYNSFGGQIALFVICSMFAGSAVVLYRMSRPVPEERTFQGVEQPTVLTSPYEAGATS